MATRLLDDDSSSGTHIGTMQPDLAPQPARTVEPIVPLLILVTGVQALATFSVFALPTLAPKAAATFGLAPQAIGYQVSAIYIAAACLSGYAGVFVRRFGACATSLAALGCCVAGLLGLASGHIFVTGLASLFIGLGYGLTNPAAAHLLARFGAPERRNLIFAIKQAGVPIGAMLAAIMLPRLSEAIGWQGAIAASSLLLAALSVPLLMRRRSWDDDCDSTTKLRAGALDGLNLILRHPVLRALALTGFCFAGFQVCLIAFAMTMLATELGWSLVDAGLAAAVMQLAGMVGRISWSLIADRFGHGLIMLSALGLAMVGFALITSGMQPSWPTAAILVVLAAFGSCLIGWNGIYMAETARVSGPRDTGVATGGVLMFNFSGVIIAPATFGVVSNWNGSIAATFGLFAVLPLLGALAMLPAIRTRRNTIATNR